ncbi:MAG: type II toxin-antitoxin system death-on-curing family toxin [Alphaproteobacteria bacterium]|nr:type II toxin-antitoxin system death-on-curing family toxin [Alphaproteobacteria bacterium]MDE2336483.1 type II toxin-antitoxin system death-on-curing family toxin [Alphaproteobacteria bacterium]
MSGKETSRRWLSKSFVLALHDMQIAAFGGASGVRDEALLESALARPQNRAAYGDPSVFDLAAAYAFGLARNHCFVDGNKRIAFVAAAVFLEDNGYAFQAAEADVVLKTLALAAGAADEKVYADWLRQNARDVKPRPSRKGSPTPRA